MMLTRFFVRIRGAFTPAPRILDPVVNIPLQREWHEMSDKLSNWQYDYQIWNSKILLTQSYNDEKRVSFVYQLTRIQ